MTARFEVTQDIGLQVKRTAYSCEYFLELYGIAKSTYYGWFDANGQLKAPTDRKIVNDRKILATEVAAVVTYRQLHKDVGYRKLTWMMIDENVAALSESSGYQILSHHGLLYGWARAESDGTEKEYKSKPQYPHHHWHTDIAYIKIGGIFYFLIMLLDGYSRYLLAWDLMSDMRTSSVENFITAAKERYPHAKPKLIHDNGSQFISHDFKQLVTKLEIQQVFTRRNHPQTNGKIERLNGTVKSEAIRLGAPTDYQDAWNILNEYSLTYNHQRLHAGIDFMRPADLFFGRAAQVKKERKSKILTARFYRKQANKSEARNEKTLS